ncbi:putative assembly protein [Thalassovita gelatinovora]|uniref:Putative assembly protein n=1 Tax=Thalassovita gelatinovora TaxID=53501 RepID=A0A0P1FCY4_THAGE|nr:AsmA family protein [Thalassovita gelatinovora]QIZ80566.1 AsmA family protein [Thalassovita gelatinovora]CUH66072.1 putative assembly protein [Thalassovita gelatinovora]SEQ76378.1 AsmA protein [Thalassovita gelatinovora]
MRWVFRLIGFVFVLIGVALVGVIFLPGDRIAQVAVDQIKAQTGRSVVLKGESKVSYYPVLGISTGALEIANADWSDKGPFMVADSLKVGVDLMALIGGEVKITGLEAVNPAILLEKRADGRVNWELGVEGVAPSGQTSGTSNALALSLDRALISGGSLRYVDHGAGSETRIGEIALDLRWPEYRGNADFDLSARPDGAATLSVTGDIDNLAALIEGDITDLSVTAKAGGGRVVFTGRAGLPNQAQGKVTADLPDTGTFMAAMGLAGVDLPQGLGRKATVAADLTLTSAMQLSLRALQITLDQNSFSGDVDVDLAANVPTVTANLSAGVVDLSGLAGSGESTGASGWSKEPIDASALGLFNGRAALNLQGLRVAGLSFGAAQLSATVEQSRAVVVLNQMAGYSGAFSGQVVANNRNGLSVGGKVRASAVEVQKLLGDLVGITRFTGQAEASLDYLGAGNSVHAIMNSLSGNGSVNMGRGTIEGIDLDSLMRKGLATGGTTVFDSLSASFTMEKGNLFNKDLLLKLPVISASGEGRVGLGAQDIDYLFSPKASSASNEKGVVIPVRIRGPWAGPKIWPDLEKAIDLNLKDEKDALREKAETRVKDKLSQELGVEVEEGQSVEDAVRQKIEDEAVKGLLNLLK